MHAQAEQMDGTGRDDGLVRPLFLIGLEEEDAALAAGLLASLPGVAADCPGRGFFASFCGTRYSPAAKGRPYGCLPPPRLDFSFLETEPAALPELHTLWERYRSGLAAASPEEPCRYYAEAARAGSILDPLHALEPVALVIVRDPFRHLAECPAPSAAFDGADGQLAAYRHLFAAARRAAATLAVRREDILASPRTVREAMAAWLGLEWTGGAPGAAFASLAGRIREREKSAPARPSPLDRDRLLVELADHLLAHGYAPGEDITEWVAGCGREDRLMAAEEAGRHIEECRTRQDSCAALVAEIADLRQRVDGLRAELPHLEQGAEAWEKEVRDIRGSLSWRSTGLLRRAYDLLFGPK